MLSIINRGLFVGNVTIWFIRSLFLIWIQNRQKKIVMCPTLMHSIFSSMVSMRKTILWIKLCFISKSDQVFFLSSEICHLLSRDISVIWISKHRCISSIININWNICISNLMEKLTIWEKFFNDWLIDWDYDRRKLSEVERFNWIMFLFKGIFRAVNTHS